MTDDTASIAADVLSLESVRRIPELAPIVARAAAAHPRAWRLPEIIGAAFGVPGAAARAAAASLACLQLSIVLVDDLLDEDPRGEHLRIGPGAAANLAQAFQAAALEPLQTLSAAGQIARAVAAIATSTARVAAGQQLDAGGAHDEAAYWTIAAEKSGAFFGLAFSLAALCGRVSTERCEQLAGLGALYGEMIQIHDDLRDSLAVPASPDWLQRRTPLPILFALNVAHPDRGRFEELRACVAADGPEAGVALEAAQRILVACGAVSYGLDQILRRAEASGALLAALEAPGSVCGLFREIVAPVEALLTPARAAPGPA